MKEFVTAVVTAAQPQTEEEQYPHGFILDGRVMRFRDPSPGEGTLMVAALASSQMPLDRFATYLDLFTRVLHPDDKAWWMGRILNTSDPLSQDAPYILAGRNGEGGAMHEIVAQWGGRPTEPSTPSSSEWPEGTGASSTPNILT